MYPNLCESTYFNLSGTVSGVFGTYTNTRDTGDAPQTSFIRKDLRKSVLNWSQSDMEYLDLRDFRI